MNYGLYHSIATITAVLAFIGVCWWAFTPKNSKRFEEDARLAIDTDPILSPSQQEKKS